MAIPIYREACDDTGCKVEVIMMRKENGRSFSVCLVCDI